MTANPTNKESLTVEILPCPFCGGEADKPDTTWKGTWYVTCSSIGCMGYGPFRDTKDKAIAAWNRRVK